MCCSSDTYKREDIKKASLYFIGASDKEQRSTKKHLCVGLRDRTMFLFSLSLALRGDSLRDVLLSDLGARQVPMLDISDDAFITVSTSRQRLSLHADTSDRHSTFGQTAARPSLMAKFTTLLLFVIEM